MKKQLSVPVIILSLFGFVVFWTVVTDAWGYSQYYFNFYAGNYLYAYISRLVWVCPAILLIIRYNDSLRIGKRELFAPPRFGKPLILVLGASASIVVVTMLLFHKGFWFNREANLLLEIVKFFVVGCVEEIVFRGWGYNALAGTVSDRKAAILSTGSFIILHWPTRFIELYRTGCFDFAMILTQSFSALVWGMVFCWLLKKEKTLWSPIIAHGAYDLMSVLLVG